MKIKLNTSKEMKSNSAKYSIIRNIEGCGTTAIITTRTNAECREYLKQIAGDHRINPGSVEFFGRGRGFHATWGTRKYTFQIVTAKEALSMTK